MEIKNTVITATKGDGNLNASQDVLDYAEGLQKAGSQIVLFEGDLIMDHLRIHERMMEKVEEHLLENPGFTLTLNLKAPHALAHDIHAGTGNWNNVPSTVGIVYEVQEQVVGDRKEYIGIGYAPDPTPANIG